LAGEQNIPGLVLLIGDQGVLAVGAEPFVGSGPAPGAGQRATTEAVMAANGWTMTDFAQVSELPSDEQAAALAADRVDAVVFTLGPGEIYVVPKSVKHRPVARDEVHLLLIEPTGTPNTGGPKTAAGGNGREGELEVSRPERDKGRRWRGDTDRRRRSSRLNVLADMRWVLPPEPKPERAHARVKRRPPAQQVERPVPVIEVDLPKEMPSTATDCGRAAGLALPVEPPMVSRDL
jgi:hypothetical protein